MPDPAAIEDLVAGRCADPFALLGPHGDRAGVTLRTFQPQAEAVRAVAPDGTPLAYLDKVHPGGLFEGRLATGQEYRLHVRTNGRDQTIDDPYRFGLLLGDTDLHLIGEGRHHDLGARLGAHAMTVEGVPGVRFVVWAPNARRVSVIGDFNQWDGRRHPMRLRHLTGVWELFIPGLLPGALYKYELLGPQWELLPAKADPAAQQTECPPATASVVADPAAFRWTDAGWRAARAAAQDATAPLAIYEAHATSWHWPAGEQPTWQDLEEDLIDYVADLGFTHIELLPIMEHPFAGSWGYQPLGQFAPTARLGDLDGFRRFVDRCHRAGLGMLLDWVPAHFPSDAHGLARFDGTALYEHADPREGFHHDWKTYIYNLGRNEVRGFLIGSALHWLERYGVDGLRVDAVASMLYRNYSRAHGEWIPNRHGGVENLEAISFLQQLGETVAARCPGAILIAEESTAWPNVSRPGREGGLGFDYKWNMGWMHDTLNFMSLDPVFRAHHHGQITFGLVYAFSERFVLPLSHDEVVHGKRSLLGRMPGGEWERFANLRACYGLMWGHPGKKLLFMGGEFGQEREWNHDAELDWRLLDQPLNRGLQRCVRDLNRLYRHEGALHRRDADPGGFAWLVADDAAQSVFAFLRRGGDGDPPVMVVANFTPVERRGYRIGLPQGGRWQEIFNSDAALYGGGNRGNAGAVYADARPGHGQPASAEFVLPPLATLMFRPAGPG